MEKNGELAKPDPWGFLEAEPEVAAGNSSTGEQLSNEAIALGITDSALADLRSGNHNAVSETDHLPGYKTSIGGNAAAAAAVRVGRRAINDDDVSRSPSPEFDTGAGKNKGRRGHENETYTSRYGAHDDDDDDDDDDEAAHSDGSNSVYSDDDDDAIRSKTPGDRTAAAKSSSTQPFRRPKFDDTDSEDDSSTSAAPQSGVPKTWGASSSSRNQNPPGGRRAGAGAAASSAADTSIIEISDQERQRLGIPTSMALARADQARFEQRKRDAGRLAMRQNASGDIDEE